MWTPIILENLWQQWPAIRGDVTRKTHGRQKIEKYRVRLMLLNKSPARFSVLSVIATLSFIVLDP